MSAIDTPDYQRGVASAQVLLAQEPGGTSSVVVGIPPNAETIVVVFKSGVPPPALVTAIGVTSGFTYPGVPSNNLNVAGAYVAWFFDVTSVVDEQLTIELSESTNAEWYVYADTGAHVVADISRVGNLQGIQYVLPTIPATGDGDHPLTELSFISGETTAAGVILAAPGADVRYRVFAGQLICTDADTVGWMADQAAGRSFLVATSASGGALPFVPQGIPISVDSAIEVGLGAGTAAFVWTLIYTIETF